MRGQRCERQTDRAARRCARVPCHSSGQRTRRSL
ncbi:MAG: CxxxxCH/CxxCH domain-containing protein [Acidobacteriia bacterium]|nr:CxxxxCH/CxxCH domain-containing protein [Terriglobia bacterium]